MAAISADGRITRGDTPGAGFASAEDQALLRAAIQEASAIVMGRATYEVARPHMRLRGRMGPVRRRSPVRYVLTSNPGRFASEAIPGVLEFTSEVPAQVLARIRRVGPPVSDGGEAEHPAGPILILGGSHLYAEFAAADLIDEWHLTVESCLFGAGRPLLAQPLRQSYPLKLAESRLLNDSTLWLRYVVPRFSRGTTDRILRP